MFTTQALSSLTTSTAGAIMKTNNNVGGSKKSNEAPVLFAVPAPSSVGKGLLCLCRKVYWTSGSLMHCAYAPVTKEEAAKLLKDPSVINILSNPVSGSNLLTVAANGAIIGVQQTVGYLHPQGSTSQNPITRKLPQQKALKVAASGGAPNEALKVPTQTAALPQTTATLTSAKQRTMPPALPKIDAVFTLADSGINSPSLKEQYAKFPSTKMPTNVTFTQSSVMSNKGPLINKKPEATSIKQSIISANSVPTHETKLSANPPRIHSNVSMTELTRPTNLLPSVLSKVPPSKGVTTEKLQEIPSLTSKRTLEQSNILSDVQNKVEENKQGAANCEEEIGRLLKRKAETETLDDLNDKKRRAVAPTNPSLKVKFSWNNRSFAEKVIDKPTSSDKQNVAKRSSKCPASKIQIETQTGVPEKPSLQQVDTAYGNITINNPQGFKYSFNTKQKLVSIEGKLPSVGTLKKLQCDELVKLGCQPSCALLQSMTGKEKKPTTKQQHVAMPSLDTLTRHPDFSHIPTGDKVTYLKELLRLQRAALGISL